MKNNNFKNIVKYYLSCNKKLILNNTRDIERKKFCSKECNGSHTLKKLWENDDFRNKITKISSNQNILKGHKGCVHPKWIKDRTKLKSKRMNFEEREFFKVILSERNYTCEITNKKSNKLSVHHLDSYSLFPDKRFDKDNVIVILYEIHKEFHNNYGYNNIKKEDWYKYTKSELFEKWKKNNN